MLRVLEVLEERSKHRQRKHLPLVVVYFLCQLRIGYEGSDGQHPMCLHRAHIVTVAAFRF
jgi:hypothetical protein